MQYAVLIDIELLLRLWLYRESMTYKKFKPAPAEI